MALTLIKEGSRFRVQTQVFSTEWLPDTPVNRQVMIVWLRQLRDERGERLFTWQDLAAVVDSANRQAASQHVEDFRACGQEFRAFVRRKPKVDERVVQAVESEVMKKPLLGKAELTRRVKERWGRQDLTASNIGAALEQISYAQVRPVLHQQMDAGKIHYQEAY